MLLSILPATIAATILSSLSFGFAQVARQEVFGVNPDDCSQTYFFGAVSRKPRNGVPDFFQLSFQIGSVFGPAFAPSEFFTIVAASSGNSSFGDYLVAPNASIKNFNGEFGPAGYSGSKKWRATIAKVNAPAQNVTGEMFLPKSIGPPAYACGPGTGTNLESLITKKSTQNEIAMLKGTNFAHMALGTGIVDASIDSTTFAFNGPMEVETSWGPPYPSIYSRFYYGFGALGPYTYVFWHVAPLNEPMSFATLGYLARDGCILVNACNTLSQRITNMTSITPYGSRNQSDVPFALPQGLNLGFTDTNGDAYLLVFDAAAASYGPTPVGGTVSFVGGVSGGKDGGPQYNGTGYVLAFVGNGCEWYGFVERLWADGARCR